MSLEGFHTLSLDLGDDPFAALSAPDFDNALIEIYDCAGRRTAASGSSTRSSITP